MSRTAFIYGLADPRTGEIRYVGRTVNLRHRTRRHLRVAGTESPSLYRDRWIKQLLSEGLEFNLIVLETIDESQSGEAETKWIAKLREEGARLTNLTDGGDGITGFEWQAGSNRGSATPGRPKSEGFGAKVSAGRKKFLAENPDALAKLNANLTASGIFATDPALQKRASDAGRAAQQNPELKARKSASLKKSWTPERRAKFAAWCASPEGQEHQRKMTDAARKAVKGQPRSEEHSRHISEALHRRNAGSEVTNSNEQEKSECLSVC